jgi:predicted Na+-dependent transporter
MARPGAVAGTLERGLLPLALAAAGLGVVAPSAALARHSDVILATLVLLTAATIAPADVRALRARPGQVAVLSVAPLGVLAPAAWVISRPFEGAVQQGVLALGLAPTEVAAVGLVAVAGGDAALALGVVAGSLVASTVAGPALAIALGDAAAGVDIGGLWVRFGLVVLVPLVAGVGIRAAAPSLGGRRTEISAGAAVAVAALVFAAISGARADDGVSTLLGAGAFLLTSLPIAVAGSRLSGGAERSVILLSVALRDFAVAAALASQAFGPGAAGVAGVYGVLMLLVGAALPRRLRTAAGDPASHRS